MGSGAWKAQVGTVLKRVGSFDSFAVVSLALLFLAVVVHLRFVVLPVFFLALGFASASWNQRQALRLFLFLLPFINALPALFFNGYPFNYMGIQLFYLAGILLAHWRGTERLVMAFPGQGPYKLFLSLLGISACFMFLRWSNLTLSRLAFLRDTPVAPSGERVSFAFIFPVITLALFSLAPYLAFLLRNSGLKKAEVFQALRAGFVVSFLVALAQKWLSPGFLAQSWWGVEMEQVNGGFSDFNAFGFFAGALFLWQSLKLIERLPPPKGAADQAQAPSPLRPGPGAGFPSGLLFLGVALLAVFVSGCRTAFLFVFFALLRLLFSRRAGLRAKVPAMLLLALALFFAGGTLSKRLRQTALQTVRLPAVGDRLQAINEVSGGRLDMLRDGGRMIGRFPLCGVGAGNFLFYLKYLRFGEDAYFDLPLNQYLLFFSETGLPGGLAFLASLVLLLLGLRPGSARFVLGAMAVALLFNNFFWFPEALLLFWIVAAGGEWSLRESAGKWPAWAAAAVLALFAVASVFALPALHPATWARATSTPYDYGFSYPEQAGGISFRWTGARAGARIALDGSGRSAEYGLGCGAPLARLPGRMQTVEVFWKGRRLEKVVFTTNTWRPLRIAGRAHEAGFLELIVRPTFNMKRLGLGEESRELGVQFCGPTCD
jgi:O-antigen ligase